MENVAKTFFSVIIPVYKTTRESLFLCLNQVLKSTYENFEIIVVMDGSNPNLKLELNKKCNDRRVKILEQDHKGLGAARNFGMDLAKGEYMLFLDSDDILLPEVFMKLHNKIQSDENLDVILFPWQNYINLPGEPTHQNDNQSNINVAVWNKCYRVEYSENIKFETGVLYEDILFTFQTVFKTNNIGRVLGNPLYLYRVNQNSSITATMDNQKHALALMKTVIDSRHEISDFFSERDILAYIYFCWKFHLDAALRKKDADMLIGLVRIGNLIPDFPFNTLAKKSIFRKAKLMAIKNSLEKYDFDNAHRLNNAHGMCGGILAVWSLMNMEVFVRNRGKNFLRF